MSLCVRIDGFKHIAAGSVRGSRHSKGGERRLISCLPQMSRELQPLLLGSSPEEMDSSESKEVTILQVKSDGITGAICTLTHSTLLGTPDGGETKRPYVLVTAIQFDASSVPPSLSHPRSSRLFIISAMLDQRLRDLESIDQPLPSPVVEGENGLMLAGLVLPLLFECARVGRN